jgi:hypothetical protein
LAAVPSLWAAREERDDNARVRHGDGLLGFLCWRPKRRGTVRGGGGAARGIAAVEEEQRHTGYGGGRA